MRRLLHPTVLRILVLVISAIVLLVLYLTGVIGGGPAQQPPEIATDPTQQSEDVNVPTIGKEDPEDPDAFISDVEKEIAEALESAPAEEIPEDHKHSYADTLIAPSCNREGYTLYECSCGDSYKENFTKKLSHSYTSKVVAPTTSEKGYTLYTCSICGDQYKDNYTDTVKTETTPQESEKPSETEPSKKPEKPTEAPAETTKPTEAPPQTDPVGDGSGQAPDSSFEEDYGICPECGREFWTSTNPTGCFSFLTDTVCDCGVLVKGMECHHH